MWTAYLAIGDSVSEGVGDDVGDVRCRSWTDWVAEGLTTMAPGLRYRNVAYRGATAADVLCIQVPAIEAFAPDLVSVTVGANDARDPEWTTDAFASELAAILGSVAEAGAQAITATYADVRDTLARAGQEIPDAWRLYFGRMHSVNEVIREVGARFDACLLDMESSEAGDMRYLSRDLTHPNALAYRLLGQTALGALAARFELPDVPALS
jgi:lysophospholipase L1-like esterase